jgi:putative glycosyltransferase (TIGR04348 family)
VEGLDVKDDESRRPARILLVTPAPPGSRHGNRVTAERWAGILGELGHETAIAEAWRGEPCDLLVALHARRSAPSVVRWRRERPEAPLVVALTGTDLYLDLPEHAEVLEALAAADRIVVLQTLALEALPSGLRGKARVIYQSASPPPPGAAPPPLPDGLPPLGARFEVCLLAHLRDVKDPLLGVRALRRLAQGSRVRLLHAGGALEPAWAAAASQEARENPRYLWLGEVPREQGLALLARCRLLLLTSRAEGGATAVTEALALGVPVLSTAIAGSEGMLGQGYPGYFPVGDEAALAALISRAESDEGFYRALAAWCAERREITLPERERESWRSLLAELASG